VPSLDARGRQPFFRWGWEIDGDWKPKGRR
jgi:hypothetical protein